jgi:hypothetical protein
VLGLTIPESFLLRADIGAEAQQSRVLVLGFLASASEARYTALAVRRSEAGYVEKQNLLIEYRWADFQYERLPGSRLSWSNVRSIPLRG